MKGILDHEHFARQGELPGNLSLQSNCTTGTAGVSSGLDDEPKEACSLVRTSGDETCSIRSYRNAVDRSTAAWRLVLTAIVVLCSGGRVESIDSLTTGRIVNL